MEWERAAVNVSKESVDRVKAMCIRIAKPFYTGRPIRSHPQIIS